MSKHVGIAVHAASLYATLTGVPVKSSGVPVGRHSGLASHLRMIGAAAGPRQIPGLAFLSLSVSQFRHPCILDSRGFEARPRLVESSILLECISGASRPRICF
jgi:hypothetical protein